MSRTEKQLQALMRAMPHLTLETIEVYEEKVLRNERQAYMEHLRSLENRKAQRALNRNWEGK